VLLSAKDWINPHDQSAGASTGGNQSTIEFPPHRKFGSRDHSFRTSNPRSLFIICPMTVSLAALRTGVDAKIDGWP